jgi:hypothetical protein
MLRRSNRRKKSHAQQGSKTHMAKKPRLFERQPKETDEAFHAFTLYREMGPKRSLDRVRGLLKVSMTVCGRWSTNHNWIKRAGAWDAYKDEIRIEVTRRTIERIARQNLRIALKGQDKLLEALKITQSQEITPAMVPSWIRAMAELEKIAKSSPNMKVELSGANGGPIDIQHNFEEAAESLASKLGAELANSEKEEVFSEALDDGESSS